jgi:hypothetical protein
LRHLSLDKFTVTSNNKDSRRWEDESGSALRWFSPRRNNARLSCLHHAVLIAACIALFFPALASRGDESGPKPGDTVGPHNWQVVRGMVGENFLRRMKGGYSFQVKEPRPRTAPREYLLATERYSDRVKLGPDGELVDYVAGLPFPRFDRNDPRAGLKLAWNFARRWSGDDFKEGGGTATGKATSHTIENDGSERKSEVIRHEIRTRGRVTLEPRPVVPGYEHVDWMIVRADEYPRDTSGTTTLETRYIDPGRDDDLYVYVPSIRRVRRAPPIQRCATLAPTEFTYDDVNSFNAKITAFNYKLLGRFRMLGNLSQRNVPFERRRGDYLPLVEGWEIIDTYALEITPKDPDYCYPKKILYIDQLTYQAVWVIVQDRKGNLWKEQFNLYTPVKLADGQEVISPTAPVIVNVRNGRTTVFSTTRAFNQGYQPSFFTLATLQTVMRGGSLR